MPYTIIASAQLSLFAIALDKGLFAQVKRRVKMKIYTASKLRDDIDMPIAVRAAPAMSLR